MSKELRNCWKKQVGLTLNVHGTNSTIVCIEIKIELAVCIGYTMRMRGYRIYTTEGEARGRVDSITPNPNCITGLYQNAEAFPLPIGSSRAVQCN